MISNETLKEVILAQNNPIEKGDLEITRELRENINIEDSFALIITGVRRCGKSTFLNQIVQKQKKEDGASEKYFCAVCNLFFPQPRRASEKTVETSLLLATQKIQTPAQEIFELQKQHL